MKFKRTLIIISIIFLFTITSCNKNESTAPESSTIQNNYILKLVDDNLLLIYNEQIVKKYEINPKVLPSEDIKLLVDGINIENENQADLIAENFDG